MKYRWSLLILCLLAPLAMAQGVGDTPGFFHIPQYDVSRYILGYIFDNVGHVLYSPVQSTIFKGVLADFNNAVLVLGAIIIIYSLIISTVNTANDGEALGKKWNNAWIPLRSAGGFALMLPLKAAGGYAIIQVFIMWVILQGVGAADTIWSHALKGIETGKTTAPSIQRGKYYALAGDAFRSLTCVYELSYVKDHLEHGKKEDGVWQNYSVRHSTDKYTPDIRGLDEYKGGDTWDHSGHHHVEFGIHDSAMSNTICGSIARDDAKGKKNARNQALSTLITSLIPPAKQYVKLYHQNVNIPQDKLKDFQTDMINASKTMSNTLEQFYREQAQRVQDSGTHHGTMFGHHFESQQDLLKNAENFGWMMAGGYYLSVANFASEYVSDVFWAPSYDEPSRHQLKDKVSEDSYNDRLGPLLDQVQGYVQSSIGQLAGGVDMSVSFGNMDLNDKTKDALKPWFKGFPTIGNNFKDYINKSIKSWTSGDFSEDPVKSVVKFGSNLLASGQNIWFGLMGATTATLLGSGIINSVTSFFGFNSAGISLAITGGLAWIMPFVEATLLAAIVNGALLQMYIPLIPYLLFTFGAIGWLILAIEAMVAGPLLALGILHPEGQHEVWGRAESGVFILASVFLRPSLMIAGFFAAIPVSYAIVGFVNLGFSLAMSASEGINIFGPAGATIFMSVYTLILIITFNRIFSLIHVLPDKILRWIGIQEEHGYSAAQDLQQIQQATKEGAGESKQSMNQSYQASTQAGIKALSETKSGAPGTTDKGK